jgi:hypothetical protein
MLVSINVIDLVWEDERLVGDETVFAAASGRRQTVSRSEAETWLTRRQRGAARHWL